MRCPAALFDKGSVERRQILQTQGDRRLLPRCPCQRSSGSGGQAPAVTQSSLNPFAGLDFQALFKVVRQYHHLSNSSSC